MPEILEGLRHDLRDGVRSLARRPAFTLVAVLSLAIGIGANTAIFSLVNAIILRASPIERPDRVLNIYLSQPSFAYSTLSYPDYRDLLEGTTDVFSDVGATQYVPAHVDGSEGVTIALAEAVTGNYFPMLGLQAAVGRTILPADDVDRGGHPVVMLDFAYWHTAFGADPGIVGRELRIGGRRYEVVGVGPADFEGTAKGLRPAFYAPYAMVEELVGSEMFDERGNHSLFVKARLRPGVVVPQAVASATAVATSLAQDRIEDWDPSSRFLVVPLNDVLLFPPLDQYVRGSAWLLMVVVGLVLLLACTNLASFLLARAVDRRKDVAVRLALGATRGSLVRSLLVETTLLSLVAGAVGVGLAVWSLNLLLNLDLPLPIPIDLNVSLEWRALAFTILVSALAGALLGLVPALQTTRADLLAALKSDTAGGGQPAHLPWRNALVVAQLTLSIFLLVGAGLFLRSFGQVLGVDPGFGHAPTALLTFMIPATRFTVDEGRAYTRRLLDRFRTIPGIDALGVIDNLHLNALSTQTMDFNVDGHEPPADHRAFVADRAEVDAGFFDAAGIRILRGRNFNEADDPESRLVAIISEAMARRFWPDGDAVGRQVRTPDADDQDLVVVGVASDAKVRTLGEAPRDMIYRPYSQEFARSLTVVARTSADPERTALDLVAAGRDIDPEFWVWEAKTMQRHLAAMQLPAKLSAFVLSIFAVLALALSTIGLYGVVSYAVAQRMREVGIRMALGASPGSVVRLLALDGLRLVVIGAAIGLTAALLLTRLLSGLLFGVAAFDPFTFVAVPLVLGGSAALAAYLPARRASRIDPMLALRAE